MLTFSSFRTGTATRRKRFLRIYSRSWVWPPKSFRNKALSGPLEQTLIGRIRAVWHESYVGTSSRLQIIQPKQRQTSMLTLMPQSTGSATAPRGGPMPSEESRDHIASARHAGGTSISLRFSDGRQATVDLAALGIDTSNLRLKSARASSWGSAVEIKDRRGGTIDIDSAVLRSYCDPQYAAELRQAIADLSADQPIRRISADKQRRLDYLMDKNNEGQLSEAEQEEFQAMVRELEQLTIDNARRLAEQT